MPRKRNDDLEGKRRRQRERYLADPEKYKLKKNYKYHNQPGYKEGVIARIRSSRKEDPSEYLWSKARRRANKNAIPFNIDIADVVIPKRCPVFGFKMKVLHKDRNRSATIDRINPLLGYTKGNVVVISFRANTIKSNATPEEIAMLNQWINSL